MANEVVTVARLSAKDDTGRAFKSMQNNMRNTRKQSQALNQQFRFMRGGLGQVGHQVQDIAVQLQMGTNAMIVFGQQGSQIASLFGPQGAMLGAVLAVGAAIAVSFSGDVKKGEDALKSLADRIKETAEKTDRLTAAQRKFLFTQQLSIMANMRQQQLKNNEAIDEATENSKKAARTLDVLNGSYATGAEVIRAGMTTKKEQQKLYDDEQESLVNLRAKADDYVTQLTNMNEELLILRHGGNPYSSFPEQAAAAAKAAGEFADELERGNNVRLRHPISREIDALEQQEDAMEKLLSSERENIQAQIGRRRSLLELEDAINREEAAIAKKMKTQDKEFGLWLQSEEAIDRETAALEKNRRTRERLEKLNFESRLAATRESLMTQEELERESIDRRMDLINEAMTKEGADKKALLDLKKRLLREEADFQERIEMRKRNAHDLFINSAIDGLLRFQDSLQNNDKQVVQIAQSIERFTDNSMAAFTDSFYDAISGAESFKDAFKNMASSIVSDLSRMLIQYYITQQIFGAITGAIGGLSKGSNGVYQAYSAAVPEPRAGGGNVTAGRPYLVGERGPELMVPKGSGDIISNGNFGGGGVTVVQNINVSTGVQQTVRAEIANMLPQIGNAAKAAVADARMRGGGFSKAIVGS